MIKNVYTTSSVTTLQEIIWISYFKFGFCYYQIVFSTTHGKTNDD